MPKRPLGKSPGERLTITLRPGQRELLEAIAENNHVSLAFAVRYALDSFAQRYKDEQIPLAFPEWLPSAGEEK